MSAECCPAAVVGCQRRLAEGPAPAQVPKMLGVLRRQWAPEALTVSFKLETDEALLIDKVRSIPAFSVQAAPGMVSRATCMCGLDGTFNLAAEQHPVSNAPP